MARRSDGNPNPYNRQEHRSFYKYSVVIDLNRIGKYDSDKFIRIEQKDGIEKWGELGKIREKEEIKYYDREMTVTKTYKKEKKSFCDLVIKRQDIGNKKKLKRLSEFIDVIGSLNHQISGGKEPVYPLFISAAHIKYGSPIFHNYVELGDNENEKNKLNGELFCKGLKHADSILKEENHKSVWAILEGSGDLHLGLTGVEQLKKNNNLPLDVIGKVKGWINEIYSC